MLCIQKRQFDEFMFIITSGNIMSATDQFHHQSETEASAAVSCSSVSLGKKFIPSFSSNASMVIDIEASTLASLEYVSLAK